jgi:cyclic pyranopterin phosphate synthase
MPAEGIELKRHSDMLTMEEIARVVRVAAGMGITKVRITGGEPLARKGVVSLVRQVAAIEGIRDIALTTNGTVLEGYAQELAAAGLKRVNVSLDTLRPETFAELTRGGDLGAVLRGIAAAERAGLCPVKINTVVLKGINSDEIESMAALTLEHPWDVRFIEFMPFWGNGGVYGEEHVVPIDEVRRRVMAMGAEAQPGATPEPVKAGAGPAMDAGPAAYVRLRGAKGRVGFISREGDEFCVRCNRIRLTADGMLRPCLLSDATIDVKCALRGGADDAAIADIIRQAVAAKPESGAIRGADGNWKAQPLVRIGG